MLVVQLDEGPGQRPAGDAGAGADTAALLVAERDHAERSRLPPEALDRLQRAEHARAGPSNRPPWGTESRCEPDHTSGSSGSSPRQPADQVPALVHLDFEPARLHPRRREPMRLVLLGREPHPVRAGPAADPVDARRDAPAAGRPSPTTRSKSAACPCPTPTQSVASPYRPSRRRSSCRSETTRRAPLMPSGCPSAMAPPLTLTRSSSRPSSRQTATLCEANASLSSTRSSSLDTDTRAREKAPHGRNGADPHHARVDSRHGRAGERCRAARRRATAARSSVAITSAAAPSLMPLALPAVTVPPSRNAGLQPGQRLCRRLGPRMLVARDLPTGTSSSSNRPGLRGGGPALLRAQRERVLLLARHAPALGDVLTRLPHRLEREHRLEARVGEPPAERRVPERAVAARVGPLGLRSGERRAAHRLDPARDDDVRVARDHRMARGHDGSETRRRRAG